MLSQCPQRRCETAKPITMPIYKRKNFLPDKFLFSKITLEIPYKNGGGMSGSLYNIIIYNHMRIKWRRASLLPACRHYKNLKSQCFYLLFCGSVFLDCLGFALNLLKKLLHVFDGGKAHAAVIFGKAAYDIVVIAIA